MTKPKTIFDEYMEKPGNRKRFEQKYEKFLLKEKLLEAMGKSHMTVRSLSKASRVSTSIIQDIRSGARKNITLDTFFSLFDTLGYTVRIEKKSGKEK